MAIAAGADDGERPYRLRGGNGGCDHGPGVGQAADEDGWAGGDGVQSDGAVRGTQDSRPLIEALVRELRRRIP